MKITSKKRSYLRSEGSRIDPVVRIGKEGLTETVIKAVEDAIKSRELIKLKMLNNSDEDLKEAAGIIAEKTQSEIIHIMGGTVLLFRENTEYPTYISKTLKEI